MPFVISFALSLLALTAGLFLLIKAKQDTGKFLRIMSWIIISCGILAVLLSLHFAIMKHVMHHNKEGFSKDNYFYLKDKLPFNKFIPFGDLDEDELCSSDEESGDVKVIIKKEVTDSDVDPIVQAKEVLKIVSENVKLTPEQEQKIKDAIEKSLNEAKKEVKETK